MKTNQNKVLGIMQLDTKFERTLGDIGNVVSYNFPAKLNLNQIKVIRSSLTRSGLITIILTIFTMIAATSPVLANISDWSFESNLDGRYLNGSANGVTHVIDAGTLIISGSIIVEEIYPTTNSTANPWTIQVKQQVFGFDPTICSVKITPNTMYSNPVSFTKDCGGIDEGIYYLVIYRLASDGRVYSGSGILETN